LRSWKSVWGRNKKYILGKLKKIIKHILPDSLIRLARGIRYGWHGDYSSWKAAKLKCSGYDSQIILDKVRDSTLRVKNGTAEYERDSVLFDKVQYSFPLLTGMMWIAACNKGRLNVLDFGGALGSSYFQSKKIFDALEEVNWCIVEQPGFVKTGQESFEDKNLHFFYNVQECLDTYNVDVVLFSSVLQYLEKPYEMLETIRSKNIRFLIVDRTPFILGKDRITVQKVNPRIYNASYPCWFFNELDFVSFMGQSYDKIFEFDALDQANIRSEFKGFVFQLKDHKLKS
jgi:putative methyltransferase (TIGR04325 family)